MRAQRFGEGDGIAVGSGHEGAVAIDTHDSCWMGFAGHEGGDTVAPAERLER